MFKGGGPVFFLQKPNFNKKKIVECYNPFETEHECLSINNNFVTAIVLLLITLCKITSNIYPSKSDNWMNRPLSDVDLKETLTRKVCHTHGIAYKYI